MKPKLFLSLFSIIVANTAGAATKIDLAHKTTHYIKPYLAVQSVATPNSDQLQKTRLSVDFNHTMHVRLQQMYRGIPVWNATAIVHVPKANPKLALSANLNAKTWMNGIVYEGLVRDLGIPHTTAFIEAQKIKAMQEVKAAFEQKIGTTTLHYEQEVVKPIVFVDQNQKAHYALFISFYYDDAQTGPHRPTTIIDVESLTIYRAWDEVKTEHDQYDQVKVGGIGGNVKIGEIIYDGAEGHYPPVSAMHFQFQTHYNGEKYTVHRCALEDEQIIIYDMSYGEVRLNYCPIHSQNNLNWLSVDQQERRWNDDEMNDGYSPSLDVFYNGHVVLNFYRDWYDMPALIEEDGKTPMMLIMQVHYGRNLDNAFWDGEKMEFGDGGADYYPLTSLDVTAHEISHGFTQQHAGLNGYEPQMRALNESFSDEAAMAVMYYATGKVTWEMGRDIKKGEGAMRYLDEPTRDDFSIDNLNDFDNTEEHAGAGIFNKAFYQIATSKGWSVRKAFNIMIKANMDYWNASMTTLTEAACGVTAATRDYGYNTMDVHLAFKQVGIDTTVCE